ncbi:MAG: hypothetical protein QM715_15130 [Nibricoccus sp.]
MLAERHGNNLEERIVSVGNLKFAAKHRFRNEMKTVILFLFGCLTCIALADSTSEKAKLKQKLEPLFSPDYIVSIGSDEDSISCVKIEPSDSFRKSARFVFLINIYFSPHIDPAQWKKNYKESEKIREKLRTNKFTKEALEEYKNAAKPSLPDAEFENSSISFHMAVDPLPNRQTETLATAEAQRLYDKILSVVKLYERPTQLESNTETALSPSAIPPNNRVHP